MPSLQYFDTIKFGSFENLSVLVDPQDESLWVTQATIARLMGWEQEYTARQKLKAKSLQPFIGEGLTPPKSVTAKDIIGRTNKFKAYPLQFLVAVLYWQLEEGNPNAKKLLIAGFADSFRSLVLQQCGIILKEEERQRTLEEYLGSYHEFTDWVRDTYAALHGGQRPPDTYYRRIMVAINRHLFGVDHFKCDRIKNATTKQKRIFENFQMYFMSVVKRKNLKDDPYAVLSQFIESNE